MPKRKSTKKSIDWEEWKRFLEWVNYLSPWNLWTPNSWQKDIEERKLNPKVEMKLKEILRNNFQRFIEETRIKINFEKLWKKFEKKWGSDACGRYEGYEINELIKNILKKIKQNQQKWLKENLYTPTFTDEERKSLSTNKHRWTKKVAKEFKEKL